MEWKDIIAALSVVLNGLPQGLLALSLGFASVPTALAFLIGATGNAITGSVAVVSYQVETIAFGKNDEGQAIHDFCRGSNYGHDRSIWFLRENRTLHWTCHYKWNDGWRWNHAGSSFLGYGAQ